MSVMPVIASGTFYPGSLFSAGQQGVWYDPSDITTIFEDSIGTTAVHTPGNGTADSPIGLLLDKHAGTSFGTNLPLYGNELITNGDFSNGTTGWSIYQQAGTGTLTASGGVATLTNSSTATYGTAYQAIPTVVGTTYRVTGLLVSSTSSTFNALRKSDDTPPVANVVNIYFVNGALPANTNCDGYFVATATTSYIAIQVNNANANIKFQNISVKALTFGAQLITNGDFSSGTTGWSIFQSSGTGTLTASGGVGTMTNSSSAVNGNAYQSFRTTIGVWYKVTGTLVSSTGTAFQGLRKADDANPASNIVNIYSVTGSLPANTNCSGYFVATSTTTYVSVQVNGANASISFKNISVVAIPGNNASQATSTSRPTLSARYNLLTYSEQFDNAIWTKGVTVTANTTDTTDPLGGNTADKMTTAGILVEQRIYQSSSSVIAKRSVYAKAGTASFISLSNGSTAAGYAVFDLSNGTISSQTGLSSASITSAGNGWYLCTTTVSSAQNFLVVNVGTTAANAVPQQTYTGAGQALYLWGADFRVSNDGVGLPVYQRIADANTYDSVGFPYYIKSDGVDDFLATSAINFSGTNKMSAFAGVRKTSANTISCVLELTADFAANNGGFGIFAPNSSNQYETESRGTAYQLTGTTSSSYASPVSNVVAGLGDISAPSITLRLNGSQISTNTSSQGTGNYANAAMYFFRRNGANYAFGGRAYGIIVRGASSTSTEISNTETWLNTKAKIY